MPSTVRPNSGTTNPPRPSAAKITSSAAAAVVSASREVGVQVTCTPWNRQTCSATRVVVTGSATRPVPQLGGHQVEHDEQRPLVADQRALLVDQVDPLADRVEPDAERRPRGRDDLGEPLHPRPVLRHRLGGRDLVQPVVERVHVDAEAAEQRGQHQRHGAARAVGDHLEPRAALTPFRSTQRSSSWV